MYSTTNGGMSAFGIAEKRLLNLAQGWATREYGLEMVDLAGDSVEIPPELDEVEWQFYKKASATTTRSANDGSGKDKGKETAPITGEAMEVEDYFRPEASSSHSVSSSAAAAAGPSTSTSGTVSTPAPKPRATAFAPPGSALNTPGLATPGPHSSGPRLEEGLVTVHIGNVRASSSSAVDLLVDAVETHGIPEPDRLDLLQKIRIATSLGNVEQRRQMLVIRLQAIAVFAHTSTEASAQSKLFLYEPELIPQLAELVHPDRNVPIQIQTAALYALDALAKFKTKLSEVASALNAGVSHGILMYVVRKTVTDLEGDERECRATQLIAAGFPDVFVSCSCLDYRIHRLAFQPPDVLPDQLVCRQYDCRSRNRFHAGRDPQEQAEGSCGGKSGAKGFLEVKSLTGARSQTVTKAAVFLDSLMYGYSSAFSLFISAGGLAVCIDRIQVGCKLCF